MSSESPISVDEARRTVLESASPMGEEIMSLEQASGHVLSEELAAPIDMPPFSRSAMDGYALRSGDIGHYERFTLKGASDAGKADPGSVGPGTCVRIHTGAPIPEGADCVIQQELASVEGEKVRFGSEEAEPGRNIRYRGEELCAGDRALEAGTLLRAPGIAFLASLGMEAVKLYQKPRVALLSTGDELVDPGQELPPGAIYESNSYGMTALLRSNGYEPVERVRVPDDPSKSIEAVRDAFRKADLLLVSGGISVGDRDHVKDALLENGVEELFHKVAQKPGKPLFFGKKGDEGKAVFGLPGNPAASLVSGYRYVLPYLRACSGWKDPLPPRFQLPIEEAWPKSSDRTVFLKAELTGDGVRPLGGQSSAMLQSFAEADALIRLPPRHEPVEKGELVEVELLEL